MPQLTTAEIKDRSRRRQISTGRPAGKSLAIGDATISFVADTAALEASVNELIERIERSLAAFKAEWNRKD